MGVDVAVKIPTHHCRQQTNCANCVRLRDPQCAWDLENSQCTYQRDWSRGSFVQNILTGISEQCPGITGPNGPFASGGDMYVINDDHQPLVGDRTALGNLEDVPVEKGIAYSGTNLIAAVIVAVFVASGFGFVIGYRFSKWRVLGDLHATSSGSSSNGSDYDSYGRARLTRHDSLTPTKAGAVEHLYSAAPTGRSADAVSLVFNQNIHGQVVPVPLMASISNGGSGIATPRHQSNAAIAMGATLPRDYKVKKVYL